VVAVNGFFGVRFSVRSRVYNRSDGYISLSLSLSLCRFLFGLSSSVSCWLFSCIRDRDTFWVLSRNLSIYRSIYIVIYTEIYWPFSLLLIIFGCLFVCLSIWIDFYPPTHHPTFCFSTDWKGWKRNFRNLTIAKLPREYECALLKLSDFDAASKKRVCSFFIVMSLYGRQPGLSGTGSKKYFIYY
jgi:hypothetical protein